MPTLAARFGDELDRAIDLAKSFEIARATSPVQSTAYTELTVVRIERVYELAFLRMFAQWEVFLEDVTARYLIGYVSPVYTPSLLISKPTTLAQGRTVLADGRDYCLWHNPDHVISRVAKRLDACPVESVVRSSRSNLQAMAAIRHRVAHHSLDARRKFDAATMTLDGVRIRGGHAGRFLRREKATSVRWLDHLASQMRGLAGQISP